MNEQRILAKTLTSAPAVVCPGCFVEMTLRHMEPAQSQKLYTGCYRCPKCGTDTKREFAIDAEYPLSGTNKSRRATPSRLRLGAAVPP